MPPTNSDAVMTTTPYVLLYFSITS